MFIERLRNVKKKWKVPAMILIVLLVLGLLSSFAYLGTSFGGGNGSGNTAASYEDNAKSAEKAVKKEGNAKNLLAAISAYDDYAAYQILYLDEEGAKESYAKEIAYVDELFALYGGQETTNDEWIEAYQLAVGANLALGDTEKARELFTKSLSAMTLTGDYISAYTEKMMAKELFTELSEDLQAAATVAEPLATAYEEANPTDEDAEASKEDAATEEAAPETPVTVFEAIQSNLQYVQMMASMSAAQ